MKITGILCFILLASAFFAVSSVVSEVAAKSFTNDDISGRELFKNNCARCHGEDGTGGKGPNLTTAKKQAKWKDSDEKLIGKITNGDWGMPAFGKKLKAEEIKAIADYVRTFKPQEVK